MTILVVDNHDSFVHTLIDYLHQLGAQTSFIESDDIVDADAVLQGYDAVLVSPGPGTPEEAHGSAKIALAAYGREMPYLGVCLGHQVLARVLGARVHTGDQPRHGVASSVTHDGSSLFTGIPSPFRVGRYHSLVVEDVTLPSELHVSARADDGVVMALRHETLPMWGVQFHPESILSEHGHQLLQNWLRES